MWNKPQVVQGKVYCKDLRMRHTSFNYASTTALHSFLSSSTTLSSSRHFLSHTSLLSSTYQCIPSVKSDAQTFSLSANPSFCSLSRLKMDTAFMVLPEPDGSFQLSSRQVHSNMHSTRPQCSIPENISITILKIVKDTELQHCTV